MTNEGPDCLSPRITSASHQEHFQVNTNTMLQSQHNPQMSKQTPLRRLHELPDDILIAVISHCNINTVFSLRLCCAGLCATIDTYISTLAPVVARKTFPGCEVLLERPKSGYTLAWLRGLIPSQLASIALDKDKLRRYPYILSGYPYGIPSESRCEESVQWRKRVATGWRVLRALYLVANKVVKGERYGSRRPSAIRKISGGVRSNRIWQAMACPYPGCTQHGMKHLFDSEQTRCAESENNTDEESDIEYIRWKESRILKMRMNLIERLPDHDLVSYVHLWRLLFEVFRPYRKPGSVVLGTREDESDGSNANWPSIIHDIGQGCSWLNWYILSVGPDPFIRQWFLQEDRLAKASPHVHHVRDLIWKAYSTRTPHQIEVEREYGCKIEYAIRRRCLSNDRLKRIDAEIQRGRNIRTISLECIPSEYDQHPRIMRPPRNFPWYTPQEWVWLNEDLYLQIKPGATWALPGAFKASLRRGSGKRADHWGTESDDEVPALLADRGPLEHVPSLVYLGTRMAVHVWPGSGSSAAEIAF